MICHFKAYGLVFLTVSTFCELQVACSNQESETEKSQGWTLFEEDEEEGEEGEGHHLHVLSRLFWSQWDYYHLTVTAEGGINLQSDLYSN